MSYYSTLQEIPGIKLEYITLVRCIIIVTKNKIRLAIPQDLEGYEEELSRFIVEDDGDIHPDEWYDIWQADEAWIRVLAPYFKNGYILFRGDESDWGYVIEEGRAYHTLP